jgi:hypothetical protein
MGGTSMNYQLSSNHGLPNRARGLPNMARGTACDLGFDAFLNMKEADMTNFSAKITYIGEQRKPLPTVVISSEAVGDEDPWTAAASVLRMRVAGIDFANDELTPMFCRADGPKLQQLIRNVAAIPTVFNAAAAARYDGVHYGKYLALSLYNRIESEEFRVQAVLGQAEAVPLLDAVGRATVDSPQCREALYILWRGLGFNIGILDPDSDGDGASDGREASWGCNPFDPDSDGDGVGDAEAILAGRDPLNPFKEEETERTSYIAEGPFRGSRVAELTTSPDRLNGHATVELRFEPQPSSPHTENLVFVQVFRRTAVKADGFTIPILPSLYIEYAGSPELDLHTHNGATVDHKVGELDPYYNGRDPQDKFIGASDKQHPGYIRTGDLKPTAMIYHCRTYEEHWRALNPEGIREIRFDYETAVLCENGEGRGTYLGNLSWSWGKERGGPVTASLKSYEAAVSEPQGIVELVGDASRTSLRLALQHSPGQPSPFFSEVLSLWLRNHKFPWPGQETALDNRVRLVVPQPAKIDARIEVKTAPQPLRAKALQAQGLQPIEFCRSIRGSDAFGHPLPRGYFPFALPLEITFDYSTEDLGISDPKKLGIVRFDPDTGRYTAKDLYILSKDADARTITFCTSCFGDHLLIEKVDAGGSPK